MIEGKLGFWTWINRRIKNYFDQPLKSLQIEREEEVRETSLEKISRRPLSSRSFLSQSN